MKNVSKYKYLLITIALVAIIILLVVYLILPKKSTSVNRHELNGVVSNTVENNKNNSNSSIGILDTIKYLPNSEKEFILSSISHVINSNQKYSIEIRNNSINQSVDTESLIYKTSFIVDIKDLKRSYKIISNYSPLDESLKKLQDDRLRIFCARGSDVKWVDPDCNDAATTERWSDDLINKVYNSED